MEIIFSKKLPKSGNTLVGISYVTAEESDLPTEGIAGSSWAHNEETGVVKMFNSADEAWDDQYSTKEE